MILGDPITFGGSGGSLSASDAILVVTVPTGSTVTATKGGVTLTPTIWVTAADPTLDCAIFSIKPSLFDAQTPWTVTATLGTDTASNTVVIDSNKEYNLTLSFSINLYRTGVLDSRVIGQKVFGGNGTVSLTNENNVLTAYNHYSSGNAAVTAYFGTDSAVDITSFDAIHLIVNNVILGRSAPKIGLLSSIPATDFGSWSWVASTELSAVSTETEYMVDISGLSGLYYVAIGTLAGLSGTTSEQKITAWYVE